MSVKPTRFLNYGGDLSEVGEFVVGPDLFGGEWRAVTFEYDEATNMTHVGFVPVVYTQRGMAL